MLDSVRYKIVSLLAPKLWQESKQGQIRPTIEAIVNQHKKQLIGLEIGTATGLNAKKMLTLLNIKHLYLIDPYGKYKDGDGETRDYTQYIPIMEKKLEKYQNKITLYRETSIHAVTHFEDNSLDFIYIDGDHTYQNVSKELELYYPKVKSQGVMGGHDFSADFLSVIQAVLDFTKNIN